MIIGIDIGGTKITLACVHGENIISDEIAFKTPKTADGILESICNGIESLLEEYSPKAIGIATAGTVDLDGARVTGGTGNLPDGYTRLEMKKVIEEKYNIPVLIENDANAAAYAEYKTGAAKGHNNTITVTLGTGIGGGIVVEGKLLKGSTGAAAEVGHMPLTWEKKRKCTCGCWDCWEAYASGTGYAITAREMAKEVPAGDIQEILDGKSIPEITTYDVIRGLNSGNQFAIRVHDLWEEFISMGIASLINVFEPDSIVLSGGMAKFVNYEELIQKVQERVVNARVKILPAKFENSAGILGAAYLAGDKFLQ